MSRISNNQSTASFIDQIFKVRTDLESVRQDISRGIKVFDPSDDPGRSGTIHNLQSLLQRVDKHTERITFAQNLLATQESTVNSANEVLVRARELATQAANGSISADVRRQMSDEIFQLRDQLAALANTQYQGIHLYGGLSDLDPPFDPDGNFYPTPPAAEFPQANVHYNLDTVALSPGQETTRDVRISDTETIRINSTARDVFLDAMNAMDRLGRAMYGVRTDLIDADLDGVVDDPDPAGTHLAYTQPGEYDLQTADILSALDAIESARSSDIETELSSIGARVNRLDQTTEILATLKINTEEARAAIQDTDAFEAASQFTNLQTALEALLTSGSLVNNLSLLDFI